MGLELEQAAVSDFATYAMLNYPPSRSPLRAACQRLMAGPADLSAWNRFWNATLTKEGCYDLAAQRAGPRKSAATVQCSDWTGCGSGFSGRAWDWQSGTEVVQPTSTSNVSDFFPPRRYTLSWLQAHMTQQFGDKVKPQPTVLADRYGLRELLAGRPAGYSRTIWFNGGQDPWSVGGLRRNLSDDVIALYAPNGAHHSDWSAPSSDDTADVLAARAF